MENTGNSADRSAFAFTCKDLFQMNSLSGLKLLAGERGMEGIINRVNIMEVPDIENWAQANEFLVTTGYSHHHNMDAFLEIIPKLAERGVAALGIKPKRFIAEVPRQVIDCAEAQGLPLFELPESTIFSNVVREVMEKVIALETRTVLMLQHRLEQVSELMLHGREMPQILETIEDMTGNPLCILDAFRRLIASPRHEAYFAPFPGRLEGFDSRSSPRHSVITVADDTVPEGTVRLHVFNLWETERDPILVLLAEKYEPCSDLVLSTVSRMLPLLNIRLSGENTYKLVKAKYFDGFLKDWLTGVIPSTEDLDIKGRLYGYDELSTQSYRAAIVKFHTGSPPAPDGALIAELNRATANCGLFTSIGGKIVALLPQSPSREPALLPESVERVRDRIEEVLGTGAFSLCIGEACEPLAVHQAYLDAENLYIASSASNATARLVTWEQLGIYAILSLLPKHANIDKFMNRYMKPMLEYDQAHQSSLVETLKLYFRMGCNIKLTAGAMFTHYNTVVYRLDKIKSLLGISFDDPEARLQLQIVLKIHEMGE
ncbi:PucR family transcriptional regulator [Paenibacillus phocaensis]|uniref:PucR family transcriptional regulator n=1 Tax=Paenibacillus phocaensis TaxID=1776378 RepID=UPI00039E498A|nr:PucR family transcriptional regulator [Paenibacillus phocaensis]